jgi:hypothetical protein
MVSQSSAINFFMGSFNFGKIYYELVVNSNNSIKLALNDPSYIDLIGIKSHEEVNF